MMKALIISGDDFEDTELLVSYYRLKFDEINSDYYDILIIPGGKAPAAIRKDKKALEITKSFFEKEKPIAAICHGPQILVTAGLLRGRCATTSYMTVASELKEAGVYIYR